MVRKLVEDEIMSKWLAEYNDTENVVLTVMDYLDLNQKKPPEA